MHDFVATINHGSLEPLHCSCLVTLDVLMLFYLAPSFDKEDPFLATDPRPRSGSGDRKVKRMNSWDDPSIGTQSESEITPRSRSGSGGQQAKITRKGSKKKKVNPSLPNMEKNSDQNRG